MSEYDTIRGLYRHSDVTDLEGRKDTTLERRPFYEFREVMYIKMYDLDNNKG